MEIRDIILDPPTVSPYDVLKAELVKRTSESEQRRLQQLISSEELGDRKPSQLLRRLQQLLGAKAPTFDAAVIRELFLQRLPVNVRMILASASGLVLPELAQLADAVTDVSTPTFTQVVVLQDQRPCTLEDIREEFHREMQNLSVRISAIATRSTSPHKRRLSTRPRRGESPRAEAAGRVQGHPAAVAMMMTTAGAMMMIFRHLPHFGRTTLTLPQSGQVDGLYVHSL
ncbi:hypothetical protein HPB47_024281 [Ixodes persulcatus]|uniref:Uncharacterized protein n=1 Tax=Ixodes persulcatus TaxID=34615 RepID=A0AC60Q4N7_IXOPE|nr:hypothetical protein HPB47_024281 [Ixodes persulcatus]